MHGSEDEDYLSDSSSEYSEDSGSDEGQAESKAQKVPSRSQSLALSNAISIAPPAAVQGHFYCSVSLLFAHIMPPRPQYRYWIPCSGPARIAPPISISLRFPKREPVKQRKRSGGRSKLWKSWTREDQEELTSSAV